MKNWRCVRAPLRVAFRWNELAGSFRLSSALGLIGGAYQAWIFPPWSLIYSGRFTGPPWGDGFSQTVFSALMILVLVGLPVVSVGGAIGLLTLPMSDENRGILAFFVMISSIFPIVFFGFDMLNFIGSVWPLWPFMIFATVWIILLLADNFCFGG